MINRLGYDIPHRLHGLDHLRTLAIGLVFILHYKMNFAHPPWWPGFASFGWTGLDLFFVLSGYLIAGQLFQQIEAGKILEFRSFFLRRFFRIIPLYLFVLGVYFCCPFFREGNSLAPLWKYLTFTQNFGLDTLRVDTFIPSWSLCVEEHFYLLLPLVLLLLKRLRRLSHSALFIALLLLVGILLRSYFWIAVFNPLSGTSAALSIWTKYIYYPTYTRMDGLLTGISVAAVQVCLRQVWNRISSYGNWFILSGVFVLVIAFLLMSNLMSFAASSIGFLVVAGGYGLIVTGAVSKGSILYTWNSRCTRFFARISYGIYLTHLGIIHTTQNVFSGYGIEKSGMLMLVFCCVFCIAGAYLLHVLIEQPFIQLGNRIKRSKFIRQS